MTGRLHPGENPTEKSPDWAADRDLAFPLRRAEYFAAVITGPKGGVSVRRPIVDWQMWALWAALLAGMGLELLTPGTPLSAFLLIPVVSSAALGRPALTALLTVVSLVFAVPAEKYLGYDVGEMGRRSLLILVAGVVGCALAATLARTTRARDQALARARDNAARLRTVSDAMLDPQILLQPVCEGSGHITDFTFADVNRAACEHLGVGREDFIGRSLDQMFPNIEQSGLLAQYVRCTQTGEPVALDDFLFFNRILGTTLRYDIRGSRTPEGNLSMTYRDVTDRFEVQQRLAASEERYRLLAENSTDIVCHIRDGQLVWVSPSIEAALGAPPEFWLGHEVFAHAPPEDLAEQAALMAKVSGGEAIKHRVRGIGADGIVHWLDLRAQPFNDTDGNQDGVAATLRLIDDEVQAEQQLHRLARFDALTGLVNRAETLGRLQSALTCARTPGRNWACCFATSIVSRPSTTPWGTTWATRSCGPLPTESLGACATVTPSGGPAVMRFWSCCRVCTTLMRPSISPRKSGPASLNPSTTTAAPSTRH